jgi:hypothetical protein
LCGLSSCALHHEQTRVYNRLKSVGTVSLNRHSRPK